MILKTRIFDIWHEKYNSLFELSKAMGLSASHVYRVRQGTRKVSQKFLVGTIRAFPERKFDELFYLTPELPHNQKARVEQKLRGTLPVLDNFTLAIDEYAHHLKSHTSAITGLNQASQELKKSTEKLIKLLELLKGDN